jgi:hypothetical protein
MQKSHFGSLGPLRIKLQQRPLSWNHVVKILKQEEGFREMTPSSLS